MIQHAMNEKSIVLNSSTRQMPAATNCEIQPKAMSFGHTLVVSGHKGGLNNLCSGAKDTKLWVVNTMGFPSLIRGHHWYKEAVK